jgi:hypothetical protein
VGWNTSLDCRRCSVGGCRLKKSNGYSGMVVRWVAALLLDMEKRFKRIMGYQQLWTLEARLKDLAEEATVDADSQVA